ncbi:MAG: ISL3-like element IS1557 family transposase [Candidatus Dormibacteraceae bacterium]
MRATTLLRTVLGLKQTRVTGVRFGPAGVQVEVAPTTRVPFCCGCMCRVRRLYDRRQRQWRHLDIGGMQATLVYDQRRVDCRRCGVRNELVPWAEPGSRFTRDFEDQVAYLAQVMDQTTTCKTMRIAWATVGQIVERVVARLGPGDRLGGLEYVGIDELSYRRHHEYITTVVDHVARKVVWAAPGKSAATVDDFFKALGPERAGQLKTVTIDMSAAYIDAVTRGAPQAQIVFDRFHVQRMAQDAVDQVRREQVRLLGGTDEAKGLKKTRWALLKNPWNMNDLEEDRLAQLQRSNRPLYRAYLLKESLAAIFDRRQVNVARQKLLEWISWARRSRLAPFKKLAATVGGHLEGILAFIATGLSNGIVEGLNGKIRTITRRAYGFHSAQSLISFIFLCCSGLVLHPVFKSPDLHPLHG